MVKSIKNSNVDRWFNRFHGALNLNRSTDVVGGVVARKKSKIEIKYFILHT